MKGYHIDAAARVIRPFEYHGYNDLSRILPGGITIGATFESGDVLYVDDESLLNPARVAFSIIRRPDGQPMMSDGILLGPDSFNTTLPPRMSTAALRREIEWLTVGDALAWFRARANEPAVTETEGGRRVTHARWADFLKNLEGERGFRPTDMFR